ncbi:MAG: hypothetical protein E7442_09700 [Ruminococcaceae bacterium]|nr:hypothetical protein [Oscillospiraceae bacterium]
MKTTRTRRYLILLLALTFFCFGFMTIADGIQRSWGRVEVGTVKIPYSDFEYLTGKLYKPQNATAETPAPAVLLLHGYQNDRETNAAYSIELARRGYVVLSLDEYGHGYSSEGMAARGWTNHKLSVNYGTEGPDGIKEIGGATRYRVMMNFSNLDFFNDVYSTGTDGSALLDSSMGGKIAWEWLAERSFVIGEKMAVSGHSMGTWSSWSVAAAYAGTPLAPRAVVLQCGELFTDGACSETAPAFNNVLLLQSKYDEFNYFRDYEDIVSDDLIRSPLRCEFLGCEPEEAEWNETYGYFGEGTARRIQLLNTNHRLATHNKLALATAMDWFGSSLGHPLTLDDNDLVYWAKECLVLLATLCALGSMLPLFLLLTELPAFRSVCQPFPSKPCPSRKKWWKAAVITMLISGFTYPFLTQLGHGLLPLPEGIFRMTIGNGFWTWYVFLILVMLGTTAMTWKKVKKAGTPMDYYDLGLSSPDKAERIDWCLFGKSAGVVALMLGWVYLLLSLCTALFQLDFRFIWPFFKTFNAPRLGQFFVYIPVFALFFLMNNAKIFGQSRVPEASQPGVKAFLSCWWRYALCMVGGILIMVLIEYIPFFMDIGPGADLLFSSTFGGPFMSLMIVFVPQVLVFSLLCTFLNRRSGHVYVSALTVGSLACWIVCGGSAML